MKFYDVESKFTFGKYEGKTIAEVFQKDPKYIDYCFNNIDEFYVSPEVMKELKSLNRDYTIPNLTELNDDEIDSMFDELQLDEDFDESKLEEDFNWEEDDLLVDDGFDDDLDDEYGDEFDDSYDDNY